MPSSRRLPVSSRHAFALAFDLAIRRDVLHSLLVPLLLRLPWIVGPALVTLAIPSISQSRLALVQGVGQLFDFVVMVLVMAMLRFRARSVFNRPSGTEPAPVGECYSKGLRRTPALYLTEALRNLAFTISFSMLVLPLLYLGFKLSLATEAVVLRGEGPRKAFTRSFHLTEARFERWLEMVALSVFLIVPLWFLMVACFFAVPGSTWNTWVMLGLVLTAAVLPIVQYAWTFFYLRLEESEAFALETAPVLVAPAPAWRSGGVPRLRLVESERDDATKN
ncbi:MAG TPA: hypothetical protein VMH61_07720 [Candidatus Acidoferrales bacterium]|nr:hypothetical protein [Candidatus Acidoferrales bacterium]